MMGLLDEIGRYPLLTAEEETDLAKRKDAGDEVARQRLLTSNLRLVVWMAKRFQRSGVDLADLVQEGYFGLERAVDRFDWKRGHRFSTYATWWIRQRMLRALDDHSRTIRLPSHVAEEERLLERVRADLIAELGRDPSPTEIQEASGLSKAEMKRIDDAARAVTSLDAPVAEDGSDLGDFVAVGVSDVEGEVVEEVRASELRAVVSSLSERQREVLTLRYGLEGGEPMTLVEVSERLGVSRERVRQIEQRALTELARRQEIVALAHAV